MPGFMPGIHVLFAACQRRKTWMAPHSGLPELRIFRFRKSGKPDLHDKPGHDESELAKRTQSDKTKPTFLSCRNRAACADVVLRRAAPQRPLPRLRGRDREGVRKHELSFGPLPTPPPHSASKTRVNALVLGEGADRVRGAVLRSSPPPASLRTREPAPSTPFPREDAYWVLAFGAPHGALRDGTTPGELGEVLSFQGCLTGEYDGFDCGADCARSAAAHCLSAAAWSRPSETCPRHARPGGLRESPTPPATGRAACRRPRTPSGSSFGRTQCRL
jgi:hypothetical protein